MIKHQICLGIIRQSQQNGRVSTACVKVNGRDQTLDLLKGMGIFLMIYRHARGPMSDFVLLFHMAIFFIASGYLYHVQYAGDGRSVGMYIVKKIRGLYLPYFLYASAFVMLNNLFLRLNIYTDNPAFLQAEGIEVAYTSLGSYYGVGTMLKKIVDVALFRSGTQIGGALWFFQTLFLVLILYTVIEYTARKLLRDEQHIVFSQLIVSLVFLCLGYYCHLANRSMHGFNRVFSVYVLIHIGRILKQYHMMERVVKHGKRPVYVILAFVVLALGYQRGNIALDKNNIENPAFFLVMSLTGWLLMYLLASFLTQHRSWLNAGIAYLSQHSIPVIAMHFLGFKIVSWISVCIYGQEPFMIAAFPVLQISGLWWLAYTAVGIAFPLALSGGGRWILRRSRAILEGK